MSHGEIEQTRELKISGKDQSALLTSMLSIDAVSPSKI